MWPGGKGKWQREELSLLSAPALAAFFLVGGLKSILVLLLPKHYKKLQKPHGWLAF